MRLAPCLTVNKLASKRNCFFFLIIPQETFSSLTKNQLETSAESVH